MEDIQHGYEVLSFPSDEVHVSDDTVVHPLGLVANSFPAIVCRGRLMRLSITFVAGRILSPSDQGLV